MALSLSQTLLSQGSGLFGSVTSASSLGDIKHFGCASPTAHCPLPSVLACASSPTRGGLDGKHSHTRWLRAHQQQRVPTLTPGNHVTKLMLPSGPYL